MNNSLIFKCLFLVLMEFLPFTLSAQSIHGPLLKGDAAYDKKAYKDAETEYRKAADRDNGNPQAIYNLANSLYQQGNFEEAGERYKQAVLNSKSKLKQADALHNLGDALLKQHRYKEAVQAYEQSLRLRPGDPDTRRNLQMAKKKLAEEEAQQKQKQQQNQQNQQNDQQNQQQQPQNNQQNQQNQQENQQQQQEQNQQGKPQQKQQPQPKSEQQLKKEEAKRLLETAIGSEDRKNARKYRAAEQEGKPKKDPKKDW